MFIPIIPNTTVINKNIVYSDTVLNINYLGSNICVTSINGVEEYELESCLKTIFENNKNVTFNTIQYSKNNNEIYFYTNKEINIEAWKNSKYKSFRPLSNYNILNEIKNILTQEENTDENSISLLNISILMKEMNRKHKKLFEDCEYYLKSENNNIILYDFDYEKNELSIGIKFLNDYDVICFSKQNDDLFITKSNYYDSNEILMNLGKYLSKMYDEFMKFKSFKTETSYGINTINSKFSADISGYGVSFYGRKNDNSIFNNGFEISSYSYSDEYGYTCNSVNTLSVIKENERELFRKIYVNIEDTPKWCQDILYEIRKEELEKNKSKSLKHILKFFNKSKKIRDFIL